MDELNADLRSAQDQAIYNDAFHLINLIKAHPEGNVAIEADTPRIMDIVDSAINILEERIVGSVSDPVRAAQNEADKTRILEELQRLRVKYSTRQ